LLVVKIGESKHEGGWGHTEKHGSCVSCASKEGEWEFGGLSYYGN
jgi:hypothetical protein